MNRRAVLKKGGVTVTGGLIGTVLAGCLNDNEPTGPENPNESEGDNPTEGGTDAILWRREIVGDVDTVTNDLVLGQELYTDENTGGIFALDSESDDRKWNFGELGPYDWYTSFIVDDAIYVGRFDDVGAGVPENCTRSSSMVRSAGRSIAGTYLGGHDSPMERSTPPPRTIESGRLTRAMGSGDGRKI